MKASLSASAEELRLQALASYDILDTLPEEEYDAITRIASQVCQTPISFITLLDDQRQWFKSAHGSDMRQTPRDYAFCHYAIQNPNHLMEITDARTDKRFADNPLTTGEPHIVFYAGIPLTDSEGQALGTLCVIDHKPNKLTDQQAVALRALAGQVVSQLQLRRSQALLKKANQELHDSNQILKAVVDNCPAGLVLWQAIWDQGVIVDFQYMLTNPVNANLAGLSVDYMVGKSLKQLFPNSMSTGLFERLVISIETGRYQQYQQLDQFDQINLWGNFSIVPVGKDQVLFTIQDITELKIIEEQLRAHTEHLAELVAYRTDEISKLSVLQNAILEHAGLAIVSTDINGTIKTANPATTQLIQYRADELIGKSNPAFLFAPKDLQRQAELLSEQLDQHVEPDFSLFRLMLNKQRYECVVISKDGRRIPILLTTTSLRDETGTITGYVAMATDITALKAARAELYKKNQELNTFFEVALDLHCIADLNGAILKTNHAWRTMLGYTAEELATINHFDLVHPADRDATIAVVKNATRRTDYNKKYTNRFRRKDGVYRIIEWNVVRIDQLLYASARDITERQQAERQLKSLNQRLQLATQAAGQGIWEWDLKNDLLTWDEQAYRVSKLEENGSDPHYSGPHYVNYLANVHPEDAAETQSIRSRLLNGELTRFFQEARVIQPDKSVRYVETHGVINKDKTGAPTKAVGVVWDITKRKQADIALRQSEERYRSLVNTLREVVFNVDVNGTWQFLNPYWTVITGYTVAESIGQPIFNFAPVEDWEQDLQLFSNLITDRKSVSSYVVRYLHKNGEQRWAEIFAQLVVGESNEPLSITGTMTDVTERKQTLDALQESEMRFREITEMVDELFWIRSVTDNRFIYMCPAYERLTGLTVESLYDDAAAFLSIIVDEDLSRVSQQFTKSLPDNFTITFRIRDKAGLLRWLVVKEYIVTDEAGVPLRRVSSANDITSQKEKELVLQHSLEREQELNRLKSQFVATVSHEFRTPLATIQSSLDLVKLYLDRSPVSQSSIDRHLTVIEKEITGFSELLSDMLTFGQIEAGKVTFNPQSVSLLDLVTDVTRTHFDGRQDLRTVEVSVAGSPRSAYVDPRLITHVLVNLVSNAFKFSSQNPELHLTFKNRRIILAVIDKGVGIPAEDIPHLFETFFRAKNAIAIQGSGLGLAITRQFVELHDGTITVCSEENKGTTCTVMLPV